MPLMGRFERVGHLLRNLQCFIDCDRTFGNPMTYTARSGRQFVVIATGAGPDASLVSFARRP